MDVVVIGGGVQGLLALNDLVEKGFSCALVSDGDLGSGQTLHSHGFLNSGFGMSGPELQDTSNDLVQPYLEARGVELSHDWVLIPPPNLPMYEGLPAAPLPGGFALPPGATAVRWPDSSFPKTHLVEALSHSYRERILKGHATLHSTGDRVEDVAVAVSATGEEVLLSTKAVVIAAGCGTKRLVEALVGQTPQTEEIKHRRVHMICVRAPHGALPTTSVAAMPLGLMLAAHDQPDNVTWYVTPLEFGGPSLDDVPVDAAGEVDPAMVVRGCQGLLALFPGLAETDGLQLGVYAGYRQDIGDLPGNRLCALVDGATNVIMALPSGLIGPWLNMTRITDLVGGLVDPSDSRAPVLGGGVGVQVGRAVEDRPDFEWLSWDEWARRFPQLSDQR
ncbi:MAG: FAD-dependent oxidoreductase [Candidatus Dormiibacterota bacterium]